MLPKRHSAVHFSIPALGALLLMTVLLFPLAVSADNPTPDDGNCINCHEDLYFLHDTGNWFCIRESPMRCVDCHGGDSTSLDKEAAHTNRKTYPILNEDASKCQECHPEKVDERVAKFDRMAGISNVLVAMPYQPPGAPVADESAMAVEGEPANHLSWIGAMEIISPTLLVSLVLLVYLLHRRHQHQTSKKKKES
jgi:hypothetical protein